MAHYFLAYSPQNAELSTPAWLLGTPVYLHIAYSHQPFDNSALQTTAALGNILFAQRTGTVSKASCPQASPLMAVLYVVNGFDKIIKLDTCTQEKAKR